MEVRFNPPKLSISAGNVTVQDNVDVQPLLAAENGTYSESGVAYSPVVVDVPNSYTQADEGKVVSGGALVAQTSRTVSDNGTYDTTLNNEVVVNNEDYSEALVAFGVQDDLTDSIEALTTYANEITGESDPTLSDAVRTLTDGWGGLEYETGIWTPEEDISRGEITFSKTHTEAPAFIVLADATGTPDVTLNTNYLFSYIDVYRMWGCGIPYKADGYSFASVFGTCRVNSVKSTTSFVLHCTYNSDNTYADGQLYPRYWADSTSFRPYSGTEARYWRVGRTYKWIAIWKPR